MSEIKEESKDKTQDQVIEIVGFDETPISMGQLGILRLKTKDEQLIRQLVVKDMAGDEFYVLVQDLDALRMDASLEIPLNEMLSSMIRQMSLARGVTPPPGPGNPSGRPKIVVPGV